MYEKPKLIKAGYAGNVVLGISMQGADPDGGAMPWEFEFADDPWRQFDPHGSGSD
jgi:hypothetical protein